MSLTTEQARERLDIESAQRETVEAAHREKRTALEQKRDQAPTDALKEKFDGLIAQLDEARDVLLAAEDSGGSSAPSQTSRPSSLSETKVADLPQAQASHTGFDGGGQPGAGVQLEAGTVLAGRYEIAERIGEGGMGAVFRAHDRNTGQEMALKVLLPGLLRSDRARERFLDEARISQKLAHPNIANVYDVQQEGDFYFLTMELLEGQSLRGWLDNLAVSRQKAPVDEARRIAGELCDALAYAHEYTVHRDIKPENIWLDEQGRVKLMDFGIARVQSTSQRTQTGAAMGTAYYMAPEQLQGRQIDARADLYAVGVLLYEMLTGQVPAGRIEPAVQQRKEIGKPLSRLIDELLSANPDQRPASAGVVKERLTGNKGGGGFTLPDLPWQGVGIAAGVLIAVVGLGAAVSTGALSGLLPDPQAEEKALALDGELETLSKRLESRKRAFEQNRDDAERRVENLERDLRSADSRGERNQLESDLKEARKEHEYAEQVVKLGRETIFESDLYTDAVASRRVGENKLRAKDHGDAAEALGEAKKNFDTLLDRAEALPELIPLRDKALAMQRTWEEEARAVGREDDSVAGKISEAYDEAEQALNRAEFSDARQAYEDAMALAEDGIAFARADASGSVGNVAKYMSDFPGGLFKDAAEGEAWEHAMGQNNRAAYEAYLDAFPEGRHRANAEQMRQNAINREVARKADIAEYEQAKKKNTIAAYDAYLNKHPNGVRRSQAHADRRALVEHQKMLRKLRNLQEGSRITVTDNKGRERSGVLMSVTGSYVSLKTPLGDNGLVESRYDLSEIQSISRDSSK